MDQDDLFWNIEMDGQQHNGDTTWLAPTADDDFHQRDDSYCREYRLPALPPPPPPLLPPLAGGGGAGRATIDIGITPIRGDSGVLDIIGGELWEACFYLCAYILQHADLFVHSTVLELGAGLGLPGLLISQLKSLSLHRDAATAPPRHEVDVCLSDKALELLEHLSSTIDLSLGGKRIAAGPSADKPSAGGEGGGASGGEGDGEGEGGCGVRVQVRHLDWQAYVDISDCDWTLKPRHPEALMDGNQWDVVVGSALVYSPSHASVAFVLR
jgi:hypothetical protein